MQNEKAENSDSYKGRTTTKKPLEKQLSDLEITNLYEKDFRLMIAKVI